MPISTVGEWAAAVGIVTTLGGVVMAAVRRVHVAVKNKFAQYAPVTEVSNLGHEQARVRKELHDRIDALDRLNSAQHLAMRDDEADIKQNMAIREEQTRIADLVEKLVDLAMHNK